METRTPRPLHRRHSNAHYDTSASTSPERQPDDDNESFMLQDNESISSLACSEDVDMMSDSEARAAMEERIRVSPISRLPAELMIAIFQKLPKTTDLRNCMLVSREWARNSVALLWHRPTTGNWEALHTVVQTLRSTQTTFDYDHLVKRLNLSSLGNQVSDGTLMPFQSCKRIERLTLTNCMKLSDLSISKVVNGNRSLAALDVTGIELVTDETIKVVARNCYRLQGLNITNCRNITSGALEDLAKACRNLKRVSSLPDKID